MRQLVWHCAFETVVPLDDVLPAVDPDEEVAPPEELVPLDEPELLGPSPFVVEEHATSTSANATVDFIPDRVPC